MKKLVDLGLQRIIVSLIVVSESKNSDSGNKIKIFFSVKIIEVNSLSPIQNYLITIIGMKKRLLSFFDIFFHIVTHIGSPTVLL